MNELKETIEEAGDEDLEHVMLDINRSQFDLKQSESESQEGDEAIAENVVEANSADFQRVSQYTSIEQKTESVGEDQVIDLEASKPETRTSQAYESAFEKSSQGKTRPLNLDLPGVLVVE